MKPSTMYHIQSPWTAIPKTLLPCTLLDHENSSSPSSTFMFLVQQKFSNFIIGSRFLRYHMLFFFNQKFEDGLGALFLWPQNLRNYDVLFCLLYLALQEFDSLQVPN
ncbi:hypothetical protein EYC80_002336 [Monilinia laxa]|uniref:Uncharacterized protein n=1 Tax=Monilinia laxa TaxID=61186 RepID=A0A5N6K3H2_MONLA|nr:hypothetical protein EYC80_002336 [Monilinia laxa]